MFTPKDIKRQIDLILEDLDEGSVPRRHGVPSWIRALAGPAALGIAVGLGGCALDGDGPTLDRDAARQAKADGFDLCWFIGAEEGCDICDELGWYGDGICDDFCDRADPDCGPIFCGPDGSCPDGMTCVEDEASACPEGAYCILPPSAGECRPECDTDEDCADGEVCEGASGACPPGAYCILAPTHGACVPDEGGDGGCPDGAYCVLPPPPDPGPTFCDPDGSCPEGMLCDEYEASDCPEGAYCVMPPGPGECRPMCLSQADCEEGQVCETVAGGCPEGAYCILAPGICVEDEGDEGGCPEGAYCVLPPPPGE